jgi:hypothetical protein
MNNNKKKQSLTHAMSFYPQHNFIKEISVTVSLFAKGSKGQRGYIGFYWSKIVSRKI